jgi:hypothetical protein
VPAAETKPAIDGCLQQKNLSGWKKAGFSFQWNWGRTHSRLPLTRRGEVISPSGSCAAIEHPSQPTQIPLKLIEPLGWLASNPGKETCWQAAARICESKRNMRPVNSQHRSPHILKLLIASAISLGTAGCVRPPLLAQITAQSSPASPASDRSANADVEALVAFGPRVAGTPVMEQASDYLLAAYRQAGYVTEVQTFTYSKFEDNGSTLTLGNTTLAGRALNNSVAGNLTARLVAVPNVGRTEDFAQVDVQGAIAIVRRGEIRFSEKASNAAAAGCDRPSDCEY